MHTWEVYKHKEDSMMKVIITDYAMFNDKELLIIVHDFFSFRRPPGIACYAYTKEQFEEDFELYIKHKEVMISYKEIY